MTLLLLLLMYFVVSSFTLKELPKPEPEYFYTSVFSLRELITTQEEIFDRLNQYVESEEHNLYILNRYLIYLKSKLLSRSYLKNPLNAFTLVNWLALGSKFIETISDNTVFCIRNLTLPSVEDIIGAGLGLVRIQTTYQANIMEMTSCTYKGFNCTPMMSSDCYELARSLFRLGGNVDNGLTWVQEALRLYRDTDFNTHGIKKADLYNNIVFAYVWLNDTVNATIWFDKIVNEEINTLSREEAKKVFFLKSMIREKEIQLLRHGIERPEITFHHKLEEKFHKVCREESNISSDFNKKLKCQYFTENHPYLILAPVKMEQLHIKPDIWLYYDVVYEAEIDVFRNHVSPTVLQQSAIVSNTTNLRSARIGKSSWVTDQSGQLDKLTERLTDISGLHLDTANVYQITNYGIGGYFEPHFDFYKKKDETKGNRIATFILYLSDVEEGGHTVFPYLDLKVSPRKGTALLFINLLQTGEGDVDSMHAACPVVKGDKWIVTKWIHQAGQELKKPCDLVYNHTPKAKIPQGMMMITGLPVKLNLTDSY